MPGLRNAACSPARTRPIAHKGPHEKIALPSSARAAGASRCEVVPRVSSGLGVFGAATLAALLGGCVHYEVSTEIRVRDPARVEVRDRASGETVLSAGSTPAEARVAHGVFATGPSTSGDYEVQVRRAPGGALRYDVDTRIALSTGEHVAILGGDGKLVPLGPSNDPALDPHTPAFIVPVCGRLVRFHTRYSQGTAATTGEGCSARSTYGATLAIPWDDSRRGSPRRACGLREAARLGPVGASGRRALGRRGHRRGARFELEHLEREGDWRFPARRRRHCGGGPPPLDPRLRSRDGALPWEPVTRVLGVMR